MQFNSVDFMIFFPAVLAVYFIIPKKARMYWLLAASYYFYMSWNVKYAVLIAASTLITYFSALAFSNMPDDRADIVKKRVILVLCLGVNLGILAVFKYGNFFLGSLNRLLSALNISVIDRRFDFLLPVGISFYTFQALGYMIDVYRGDVRAEKNIFRYALFVSFFPQLVAGPIERSGNLLSQMQNISTIKLWNAKRVTSGAILMVWGLFMKMVIADRVSIIADTVFNDHMSYGTVGLAAGALAFTLQIYCDFGSYSMIAIGAAKIMGFDLMENFKAPYFARSVREFWSRWHISLSTWFRDYLYIPLGGGRKGKLRKAVNTMAVFLVSGLWHGANWSFVVWGGIHGLCQIIGDATAPLRKRAAVKTGINTDAFSWKLLRCVFTFALVSFAWIFFRANSTGEAFSYISRMFTNRDIWLLSGDAIYTLGLDRPEMNILIVSAVILLLVDLIRVRKGQMIDAFLLSQNIWFEWTVIIVLILMIITFGEYGPVFDAKQFIYFQF